MRGRLDAIGALRIPDPTTAGDFCRQFDILSIELLQKAINEARLKVWKQQPPDFFEQAVIDSDGTLAPTTGQCKKGMDISYKGTWGYHPLVVSLANTQEPLFLVNRSGNQTSSDGAAAFINQAVAVCKKGGFKKIRLRGDTDFSQTAYLDGWNEQGILFNFGFDAMPNLVEIAKNRPEGLWEPLIRKSKYTVKTEPRQKPANVKQSIVIARNFKNLNLQSEHVAEFEYKPGKCKKSYRGYGLLLPTGGRWDSRRQQEKAAVQCMEFKKFIHYFIHIPCQIIRSGRRLIYRILGWNRYLPVLLRAFSCFRKPLRC